jgi:hypothetical protein
LQVKKKASEKLEKLNRTKEQIEAIQIEIDEMKEQFTVYRLPSDLWQFPAILRRYKPRAAGAAPATRIARQT